MKSLYPVILFLMLISQTASADSLMKIIRDSLSEQEKQCAMMLASQNLIESMAIDALAYLKESQNLNKMSLREDRDLISLAESIHDGRLDQISSLGRSEIHKILSVGFGVYRSQRLKSIVEQNSESVDIEFGAYGNPLFKEFISARDNGNWRLAIEIYETKFPQPLKRNLTARQQYAFVLNRNRQHDKAIQVIEEVIKEFGADGESLGIYGRIYKDLFHSTQEIAYLDKAIELYQRGFDYDPTNYYPGMALQDMLFFRGTDETLTEAIDLAVILERMLARRMIQDSNDFWDVSSYMKILAIRKKWDKVNFYINKTLTLASAPWQIETVVESLQIIHHLWIEKPEVMGVSNEDIGKLESIMTLLSQFNTVPHSTNGSLN
ncbi:MAG: DUF4071 domain-containing protein [Bdellovibrionales bacterium]|nr:DUF4071 domain-containing protein [Bdellovibrionales bacterium]